MGKKYGYSKDESGNICYSYPYFPVGYIYISAVEIDLATIFGGTWEQIEGKFLLACSSNYIAGSTGGEATHTLTTSEMPAHTHGSKELTGQVSLNALQSTSGANLFHSRSGIIGRDTIDSGYYNNTDRTAVSDQYATLTIDATHEHNSVGGGNSHNNMPPYLAVYMYKKTAN